MCTVETCEEAGMCISNKRHVETNKEATTSNYTHMDEHHQNEGDAPASCSKLL